jgi:Domain of unknown function (DUF4266)
MKTFARALALLLLLGPAALCAGCGTVRPWQKEHLADPTMSFDDSAREAARELHWIEAREGSTGGTGSAGGGCACN